MKPYIIATFLCEKVLEDKDGVLSAVRIVDVFNVRVPKELPSDTFPTLYMTMVAIFKSEEPSEYTLTVEVQSPSGQKSRGGQSFPLALKGKEHGANMILHFPIPVHEYGLYWLDLVIDGERMTRVPFKIQLASDGESAEPASSIIH